MAEPDPGAPEGAGGSGHRSVLLEPAIDFLSVKPAGTYLDATVGAGGHSFAIAKRLSAPGRLIGFDKDPAALERARARLEPAALAVGVQAIAGPQIELRNQSFAEVGELKPASVDGILADLGLSSLQLSDAQRGFSFQAEGPLDMR